MDHGDHFLYKVYIIYVYVPLDLLNFQIYFRVVNFQLQYINIFYYR